MWLPEIVRRAPAAPLVLRWIAAANEVPAEANPTVANEIRRFGARLLDADPGRWQLLLPWQTLVYGLVGREVDEQVTVEILDDAESRELRVTCLPVETHAAHAAGAGGVALIAIAVWLIGGWSGGLLPCLAALLAGGLWADFTRAVAMQRLEQRLRDLAEAAGLALWPDAPAQLLPPPTRPRI
ncbi:MAG TPA: hypothetical protein PKJ99_15110 [Thermoanaerobaculales bacterium]|nr:hypothetical protein [Thermoanaerobaculales bacterium]HPA81225.1 hypothetical protein [Thermoanaerobaculales bacterium]HQL31096.1 hypothetical protein [Thermoanaerobaculales bacterium]HQN97053.1 hypothetical protein [Thermoanaerobaculales bacterium]HQP44648.1 hypothetical protein [Thermoanaerobaculales bacterium]